MTTSDAEVIKRLSKTVVHVGLLMWVCSLGFNDRTPKSTVRWAAKAVLLFGFYYVIFHMFRRCGWLRRRGGQREPEPSSTTVVYTDLPQMPPSETTLESALIPMQMELNTTSVYVYVYGWGVLLFVCLYCIAGLNETSSCWWMVGMMMLSFDELITRNVSRVWVVIISLQLWAAIISLWWAVSGSRAEEQSAGDIMLSIVFPVLTPNVFFSLRFSVRSAARNVRALCEVALPFMVLISFSILVITFDLDEYYSGGGELRGMRSMGNTSVNAFIETPAPFDSNYSNNDFFYNMTQLTNSPEAQMIRQQLMMIVVPPLAGACILSLADCVVHGFVTEFIASFLLVLTVKNIIMHSLSAGAVIAVFAAGVCFVVLILLRKQI